MFPKEQHLKSTSLRKVTSREHANHLGTMICTGLLVLLRRKNLRAIIRMEIPSDLLTRQKIIKFYSITGTTSLNCLKQMLGTVWLHMLERAMPNGEGKLQRKMQHGSRSTSFAIVERVFYLKTQTGIGSHWMTSNGFSIPKSRARCPSCIQKWIFSFAENVLKILDGGYLSH